MLDGAKKHADKLPFQHFERPDVYLTFIVQTKSMNAREEEGDWNGKDIFLSPLDSGERLLI